MNDRCGPNRTQRLERGVRIDHGHLSIIAGHPPAASVPAVSRDVAQSGIVDEARTAALWRVSAGIASPAGLFVDEAIQLAVEMLDEGDQRGAIFDVAALSPGTARVDAIEPVIHMLAALKIDVVQSAASEPERTLDVQGLRQRRAVR